MHNKRVQSAMQLLMPYGWAILAAIIAIGVLAYFGVFSPGKLGGGTQIVSPPFAIDEASITNDGGGAGQDRIALVVTQNLGESVTLELQDGSGDGFEVKLSDGAKVRLLPQIVGVYFNTAIPDQFLMFADLDEDNRYTAADGIIGDPIKLLRGIKFTQFSDTDGIQTVINIVFVAPQADMVISNQETSSGKTFASLTLRTPNQQISKTISIWKSGQISLD